MSDRFKRLLAACCSLAWVCAAGAAEPGFPTKPIRVIVPAAAGGNLDLTARIIGQKMGETLGQQLVVENRAGGNSLLGTRQVMAAPADGYTLLAISNTFVISPSVLREPGYNPVKDFTGIGLMNSVPLLAVTAGSSPHRSLKDLVAAAKRSPSSISYASGGTGTSTHLGPALFLQQAGIALLHVPYKGNAPAIADVLSGQVGLIFDPINTSAPYVRDGRFRALGITSARRSPLLPNVPTIAEQGFPDYDYSIYTGLAAPAGTPREAIARLHDALQKATSSPDMRERFTKDGTELISGQSVQQFNEFLRRELTRYAALVKAANIKVE